MIRPQGILRYNLTIFLGIENVLQISNKRNEGKEILIEIAGLPEETH